MKSFPMIMATTIATTLLISCEGRVYDGGKFTSELEGCYSNITGNKFARIYSDSHLEVDEIKSEFVIYQNKIGFHIKPMREIMMNASTGVVKISNSSNELILIDRDMKGFQLTNAGDLGHFRRSRCPN